MDVLKTMNYLLKITWFQFKIYLLSNYCLQRIARCGRIERLVWHRVHPQGNRTVVDRKDRCPKNNDTVIKETWMLKVKMAWRVTKERKESEQGVSFGREGEERVYKGDDVYRMFKNLAHGESTSGGRTEMSRQRHRIGNARCLQFNFGWNQIGGNQWELRSEMWIDPQCQNEAHCSSSRKYWKDTDSFWGGSEMIQVVLPF